MRVRFHEIAGTTDRRKVNMIKEIRLLTGMGLKEAKQLLDESANRMVWFETRTDIRLNDLENIRLNARGWGYAVTLTTRDNGKVYDEVYLAELRVMASEAILAGHSDIAHDLTAIIDRYQPFPDDQS